MDAQDVGRLFAGFTGGDQRFRGITDRLGGRPMLPLLPAGARLPDFPTERPPSWNPLAADEESSHARD
jgi:hypothetical protein